MLTVAEAFHQLLVTVSSFGPSQIPLHEGLGLCLASDVFSSSDSPPFDKSLMDGFAIRSQDVAAGNAALRVIEVITAGTVPTKSVGPDEASQIMTGAPVPDGADAVIKIEETRRDGDSVLISTNSARSGANIIRRGTSVKAGDCVLRAGMILNGARIGALAELGLATVETRRRPRVAVLATGDELVPVEEAPGPGQIRNSNASMLAAQIEAAGAIAISLGIARDNRDDLRSKIATGLACDLLVLSGGVSAGTLDLVPSVLTELGVREVFHKVEMKPGKPIWFGEWTGTVSPSTETPRLCHVFGLPGNPVSSLVCCELFVRTAIKRLMGIDPPMPQPVFARLEHDFSARADRPTYHPARLTWTRYGPEVSLVSWHGSSDLCGTVAANAMALLNGDARQYDVGDLLETFAW
jgi:molybdopterin molybdotransferase